MIILRTAALITVTAVLVSGCERGIRAASAGQPSANAQGAATLEFQNRIRAYFKVNNEAASRVPNLKRTDDPAEISGREAMLAKAIPS